MDIGWIHTYEEVARVFWGLGLTDSVSIGEPGYAEVAEMLRNSYGYPEKPCYEVGEVAYELLMGRSCEALIERLAE